MTERPFDAVAQVLEKRAGLALERARYEQVERAARKAMARAGIEDPARYAAQLAAGTLPLDSLLDDVTVGETYFFRDPAHFELVRRRVLPPLRGRAVRAWSAGCSSGEEAYSLAILFEQEGIGATSTVIGTDIAPAALARAREALYRPWSLRGPGAAWVRPWLRQEAGGLRLAQTIRARVRFSRLNLAADPYPGRQDLIFCRNVLIYLAPAVVTQVAQGLFDALVPGGWLFTGPSDPPLGAHAPFQVEVIPEGMFYQRPAATKARPAAGRIIRPIAAAARSVRLPWSAPSRGEHARPPPKPEPAPAPAAKARARAKAEAPEAQATAPPAAPAGSGAAAALAAGRYEEAARLSAGASDPATIAIHLRALANGGDLAGALRVADEASARHPFSTELLHLRAVLLADLGRDEQALEALRSLLYLEPTLAMGHFLRGLLLRRAGATHAARRALQRARDLAGSAPPAAIVPLSDGLAAGRLTQLAAHQLASLE